MGWAVNDAEHRAQAHLDKSKAKAAFYDLKKTINRISHTDKRNVLEAELQKIDSALNNIEYHLDR